MTTHQSPTTNPITLQQENSQLKPNYKILRESITYFHQENKKLQVQKYRLSTTIHKMQSKRELNYLER